MAGLKLGFHYHVPAYQKSGKIFMPGYQGRFIDSLATYCEQIFCFLHTPTSLETDLLDYCIQSSNVAMVEIGPQVSVPHRMINAHRYSAVFQAYVGELNAVLLRGPSPLLPFLARAAKDLPIVILLVGDYLAGIDDSSQPRWRKEAIRWWAKWYQQAQLRVAQHSLTFVNSRKLFQELQPVMTNLIETRTTTLTSADFFIRGDTCKNRPYRLLYTGRMDRAKGLLEIVEALALLVSQGEDVVLDLVGWPEKHDSVLEEITILTRIKGITDRVHYHGYKGVGPELFAYYRQADLFVIASKSNFEGFPRSIWEAMAHSLPVVATKVGSIPHFIQGASQLVEPNTVVELSESIGHLLHSPKLRQKLIQHGQELARLNTLEGQAKSMVTQIEKWLTQNYGLIFSSRD